MFVGIDHPIYFRQYDPLDSTIRYVLQKLAGEASSRVGQFEEDELHFEVDCRFEGCPLVMGKSSSVIVKVVS